MDNIIFDVDGTLWDTTEVVALLCLQSTVSVVLKTIIRL